MEIISIVLITFTAGYIHSTLGFGNALIILSLLPLFVPFKVAAMVSVFTGCIISFISLYLLRTWFDFKKIYFIFLVYIGATTFGVVLIKYMDDLHLQRLLGFLLVFIVILSRSGRVIKKSKLNDLVFSVAAGILGGMFAMGGPVMVYYLINTVEKKEVFKSNIDFVFGVSGLYSIILHSLVGNVDINHVVYILTALAASSLSVFLGIYTFKKVKFEKIRKAIYLLMFCMGLKMIII